MSLIPRNVAVAGGRRLYEPEAMEGADLPFFSETLKPEEADRSNRFEKVYNYPRRQKMKAQRAGSTQIGQRPW
jgi:hypothetical protein